MKENRLPYNRKSGFQIPQDYLEDLEERLMSKVGSLESGSSPLEKTARAFRVPENYFVGLEDRVMENINKQQKKEPKVISLFRKEAFYYVAGIAAVLLAIVTNISPPQTSPQSLENLDMLSLETYLEETIDYSDPEMPSLITEEMYFATSAQTSNIDQEAVMQYLHENLEEPSLIFNEN